MKIKDIVQESSQSNEFKRWFGDSEVIDTAGKPLKLFHGTNQDFTAFAGDMSREDGIVFFTNNSKVASDFALYRTVWNGANVMPVYVRAKKLLSIDGNYERIRDVENNFSAEDMKYGEDVRAYARRKGYSGIIFRNVIDPVSPSSDPANDVYALFADRISVKSAIGNRGTYDSSSSIIDENNDNKKKRVTDTPAFKRWFGNSKVVDSDGNPLVVYHGTAAEFSSFDNSKTGTNDRGLWGRGHYFSASVDNANSYALRQGDNARIIPAYVSIKNPLILKTGSDLITRLPDGRNCRDLVGKNLDGSKIKELAISGGHDGVIQIRPNGMIGDLVAYNSEQIKSAIGNRGTYDSSSSSIIDESANISIEDEVTDSYSGQINSMLTATIDGKVAGVLSYVEYGDDVSVNIIKVLPEFRRKGVGRQLMLHLQKKFPDTEIDWGMMSDEGAALRNSLQTITKPTEHADKIRELELVKDRIRQVTTLFDKFDPKTASDEEKQKMNELYQTLNDLHDRQWELEQETMGKKRTKTILKTI